MPDLRQYANEQRYNLVYWHRRLRHRHQLPKLSGADRRLVSALAREGAVMTSLAALGVPGTAATMTAADDLMATLGDRPPAKGGFGVQATQGEIDAYPDLIRWGLDERLLAIVGNYIGLPVVYRGLTVRRDLAGGEQLETRLFHRDNEDNRIVKIIVYLNDVDETGGPYEFIPRSFAPASWRIRTSGARASDEVVARIVPPSRWVPCNGARGAVIFSDTCRVFHRGRIAQTTDRRALFFCYNSAMPLSPQWCNPLFDRTRFLAAYPHLSPAQRAAISTTY
jgi:hypothetical protein